MLPFLSTTKLAHPNYLYFCRNKKIKMNIIRKISVGTDFPNGCMHYQLGKKFEVLGELCEVTNIISEIMNGVQAYNIYVQGKDTTFLWKSIENMPVHK